MKHAGAILICLLSLVLSIPMAVAQDESEYEEGELLVKFRPGISLPEAAQLHAAVGSKMVKRYKKTGIQHIKLRHGLSTKEAVGIYGKNPSVEYAEPNYRRYAMDLFPNDPAFGLLRGLHNTGQSGGTPDADIDAPEAWQITTGSDQVVVAVIDSGVDYDHEDLSENMWVNIPERDGFPGIDDDGNGYVDDIHGIDAVNDDTDPMDDLGHGTHCAGTIGAVGNNSIGVVGVNWNVKIMALKFLSENNIGYDSDAIECLEYAMMMKQDYGHNVRVTNNSWGGGPYTQALYNAIQQAADADILFIASAGNDSHNNDTYHTYPASFNLPSIISVAATDPDDDLASFSNWGPTTVDVAAPGVGIYSTFLPFAYLNGMCQDTDGDGYAYCNGTSMAAPHVSGLAALILALNASYTWDEVKAIILTTVDPLASLEGLILTEGRINANLALQSVCSSTGKIQLDGQVYSPGADINIQVWDADLNTDPMASEQYSDIVSIETTAGDEETNITLTEIGTDSCIFVGTITTADTAVTQEDGMLQLNCQAPDTITATYYDADDGTGNPATPSDEAGADCAPPVISNVQAGYITYFYTTISWDTDEAADSCVYYGTALPLDFTKCDSSLATHHAINLTGLSLDTTYYFAVGSMDEAGNEAIDDNNGDYYQFHSFVPGTHYVPDEYSTIQTAINAMADYDRIVVRPGTYFENIDFLGKTITVIGEGGSEETIIDGGASGSVVTFSSGEDAGSILEAVTITNGSASSGGGIYCANTSTPTIANCIITGNTSTDGGGIYCESSSSPAIKNCTIVNNAASADGGGIYCASSASPTVINTILWGDTASGNPNEIYVAVGASIDVSYSDIDGEWTGTGNIDCDPQFLGSGDYHLRASSCCIDAGTGNGAPAKDIDGDSRPHGNGYDIGADEYTGQRGHLVLDRNAYSQGVDVNILVMDSDLNTNPAVAEQYSDIVAIITAGGDEEADVTFTETGPDSAIFTGSIATATTGVTPGDGILQMALMTEIITATYDDADDGTGNPGTPSDTALADCFPPLISGITATPNDAGTAATIQWDTNEDSDTVVYFGESPALAQMASDSQLVNQHAIVITPLSPGATYYYDCASTDGFGNTTRDDNGSLHYQFTTPCPEDISTVPDALSIPMCPGNVYTRQLYINNDGCETLAFTIIENIPWLTLDHTAGTLQGGWTKPITINIDASSLGVGTYEGTLAINSNDPDEPSLSFPVTLKIGYAVTVGSVSPISGYNGLDTGIEIIGSCFEDGAKASLYGGGPHIKGSCNTPDSPNDVYVSGDHVYVAGSDPGFQVIDISDPASPSIVGSCYTPANAGAVCVSGGYAYVADWNAGLQVIDVTDPSTPSIIGSSDTPGTGRGVDVSGNYAYIADYYNLQVIDVTDPAEPFMIGSCAIQAGLDVCVSGDYAYVAATGLQIIDITDPANPFIIGSCSVPNYVEGVYVSGNYAYVAQRQSSGHSHLYVIDIIDPANPFITGSCDIPDEAEDVYVSGDYAYVADEASGVQAIDVSDPSNPSLVGSCQTGGWVGSIHGSGNYACVGDASSRVAVIDISDSINPSIIGSSDKPEIAHGVYISGGYAYVGDGGTSWFYGGLEVIDISDPANPSAVGSCNTTRSVEDVFVSGNYAYATQSDYGLEVIDISDPANPFVAGSCDTPGSAHAVFVSGDYAYVADWTLGLQVIDITDPASPSIVGSYDTPNWAEDVHVSGAYAYVADSASGLQVINVSDPANPALEGSYDTPGSAWGVYVSGAYAYVADENSGLTVIDISNPASPSIAGSCDTPGVARKVYVSGNYAYVADEASGVQVIDVTDPGNPLIVGSSATPHEAYGVYVAGGYVYVADSESGLQVMKDFVPCADVNWTGENAITGTVPAGFLPGTYNLHVTNSDGGRGVLYNAFTVTDSIAAATADFSAIPTIGYAPLEVKFTDMSTGTIDTWAWDFDNNGTTDSNDQHPSFTYQSVGTYTVKLTVAGLGGSDSETKTNYIFISEPAPPVADFAASPTSGTAALEVAFTDKSTGDIETWAWDFDNNGTTDSNDQDPTFSYQTAGIYTVKLTVTGPGGSDSKTKPDYIQVSVALVCTDNDADGYGVCPDCGTGNGCTFDGDDCDDTPGSGASIHPGATEVECDGIDQDCSGADSCPCTDNDGDGYGNPASPECTYPELDCDDTPGSGASIHPGATEVTCDGIDQDCDGSDFCNCTDNDLDGYGNPGDATCPNGSQTDCNDGDDTIYPGATEVTCDGIDQDCNGDDLCCVDNDLDGYGVCPDCGTAEGCTSDGDDCNDGDGSIYPGATEVECDGIDQDCSGADQCSGACADGDGDGYGDPGDAACPNGAQRDCNDGDDTIYPGATEVTCDGIDQDCDGSDSCVIEIIIDSDDPAASYLGTWGYYTGYAQQYDGDGHYSQAGTGADTFTWRPDISAMGAYNVYAWWHDGSSGGKRATNAPYTINHAGGSDEIRVNQQINGGQWNQLGTTPFIFFAGTSGSVVLSDQVSFGNVIADAVRWERVDVPLYEISGQITEDSVGLDGITVQLTGDMNVTTVTSGGGNYSFTVMAGNYTVTPKSLGYTYTPQDRDVGVVDSNVTGQDFVAVGGAATEIIVNNADPEASYVGTWGFYTGYAQLYNNDGHYSNAGTGADQFTWRPDVAVAGFYNVYAWWHDASGGGSRADNAPYTINHADGSEEIKADQRINGGQWNQLGTTPYYFASGTSGSVVLTDAVTVGNIIADAVRWVPVAGDAYVISGQITEDSVGLDGITVQLTGDMNVTTVTSGGGNYSFTVLAGNYTVTPTSAGYDYTPDYLDVGVVDANVSGQNFTAVGGAASGIIVDSDDPEASYVGTWGFYTGYAQQYDGDGHYSKAGTGADKFTWRPDIAVASFYNVYAWWHDASGGGSRASNAPYTIYGQDGSDGVRVNMQINGGQWNRLGTTPYYFAAGTSGSVVLSDDVASGNVIADAVRWEPVAGDAYVISGQITVDAVGADDITVELTGDMVVTTLTSAGGNYSFTVLPGNYTVTPTSAGTFTPAYRDVQVIDSDMTGQDFAAELAFEIIIDNDDPGTSYMGIWPSYSGYAQLYDGDGQYNQPGSGAHTATWRPTIPAGEGGQYRVYAWWHDASSGGKRASNAPYTIYYNGGSQTVYANQTVNGGQWNVLGTYSFAEGTAGRVMLSDNVAYGNVIADAVRFLSVTGP